MDAHLRELLPFLRDRNPSVRQIALAQLLPCTPNGAQYRSIFLSPNSPAVRDLKLLCRDQLNIAHDAFRALVNLSDSPALVASLSESSFLHYIVSYIINPQSMLADLASMLLSNLSSTSVACSALLSLEIPVLLEKNLFHGIFTVDSRCATCPVPAPYPAGEPQLVPALPLLVFAFVDGAQVTAGGDPSLRTRKADLHFLASVFANLTTVPAGRTFFLSPQPVDLLLPDGPSEYPLAKLVAFTEHKNVIRRGGVASTLKNCAFLVAGHKAMLSSEAERVSVSPDAGETAGIDALPYLLLPLAGPEEFELEVQDQLLEPLQFLPATKEREQDQAIRLIFVETLLLLSHTRWGRDYMRNHGVYQVLRAAHLAEGDDKVAETMERLVQMIHGNEVEDVDADATAEVIPCKFEETDEDDVIQEV